MLLWIFLSVQICGSLKHNFTHCSYASLCETAKYNSYPKVEGWKECGCVLNLDNCAAACIYGAEQNHYSPIPTDGRGQLNGCLYSGRSHWHRCLGD